MLSYKAITGSKPMRANLTQLVDTMESIEQILEKIDKSLEHNAKIVEVFEHLKEILDRVDRKLDRLELQ